MKLCDFMDYIFPEITEFPEMIRIIDYKNSIVQDFYGGYEGEYSYNQGDMSSAVMKKVLERYYDYNICGMIQTTKQELNIVVEE